MGNNLSIEPTSQEKQAVLEDLLQANQIRLNAQMPLYDIHYEYSRKLTRIRQNNYRKVLEPYIQSYLIDLPVLTGFAGRIGMQIQAECMAARHLFTATGIQPVTAALPSITDRIASYVIKPNSN